MPYGLYFPDEYPEGQLWRRTITIERPLAIMRHQVSAAEYQRCVDEGACTKLAPGVAVDDRPAVQVSWRDAEAYGTWLSRKTGIHYRLPSDQEWAIAAGTLFRDDALPDGDDGNPAQRWLAKYESEASSNVPESDQASLPITSFAVNENGLFQRGRRRLGMDQHLLRAPGARWEGRLDRRTDCKLRGACGRRAPSHLYF